LKLDHGIKRRTQPRGGHVDCDQRAGGKFEPVVIDVAFTCDLAVDGDGKRDQFGVLDGRV